MAPPLQQQQQHLPAPSWPRGTSCRRPSRQAALQTMPGIPPSKLPFSPTPPHPPRASPNTHAHAHAPLGHAASAGTGGKGETRAAEAALERHLRRSGAPREERLLAGSREGARGRVRARSPRGVVVVVVGSSRQQSRPPPLPARSGLAALPAQGVGPSRGAAAVERRGARWAGSGGGGGIGAGARQGRARGRAGGEAGRAEPEESQREPPAFASLRLASFAVTGGRVS